MSLWVDDYEGMPDPPNYYKQVQGEANMGPHRFTWQRVERVYLLGFIPIWFPVGQPFRDWDTCFKRVK